ncbi:hypothetical protein C10C_0688 [Chlamydia serpentis]|uniref:Uncharacterized protein n=1 Tax=Chlamydia serpentis TaxID=1967782 RepID=A0A2R8FBZ1_9CHLA|nr:hypothetical protein [Chlamydia serpentis]SPN73836.1 hypothetical protein C10C_0688 [Chlamydia serpentis]
MSFTYFLALPIDAPTQERLLRSPKRWESLLNSSLYLRIITHQNIPYLAKELPRFPLSIEDWEKTVLHVSSLLKSLFLCSDLSPLRLLVCSKIEQITLKDLDSFSQNR